MARTNRNFHTPDILFDIEAKLDLDGVMARLLWYSGAHTKEEELTFVEPDNPLVSGDVVENKTVLVIFGGTRTSWLRWWAKSRRSRWSMWFPIRARLATDRWSRTERNFIAYVLTGGVFSPLSLWRSRLPRRPVSQILAAPYRYG